MTTLNPEEQATLNVLLEEYRTTLGEIGEESKAQLERRQAFEKVERQIADIQDEANKANRTRLEELNQAQIENQEAAKEYQKEIDKINKELRDSKDLTKEQREEMEAEVEILEQQLAVHQLIKEQLEEQQEYQKEIRATADDILGAFTGIKEQQSGVVGLLQKGMNDGRSFGSSLRNVGSSMLSRFKELATPINIAAMGAAKIVESTAMMVINTDNALARFNEMTTAGGKLNDIVIDVTADTKQFGVNMEQTVAAAGDLYTEMSGFTELTREAQSEVLELASALTKAGVAAKDTAQIQDLAMKGFAMSSAEANNVSLELLATAQALNVPAGKMASDFNSAMDELAKYGPEGIEVFKELAAQAKASGVEMSTLLGIAKGFDTIEGAAESTSKLNAILGSTMNSMEMLSATDSERIMMTKRSIEATGRSFASMERHEKQAIANAAGISSMADASKLFGTNAAAFDEAMSKIDGVTGATADLEGATSASTSMQEKMTLLMEQFAVAVMPIAKLLTGILSAVLAITKPFFQLLNFVGDIVAAVAEFIAGSKILSNVLLVLGGSLLFMKFVIAGTNIGLKQMAIHTFTSVQGLKEFGHAILLAIKKIFTLNGRLTFSAATLKGKFLGALGMAKGALISLGTTIKTHLITPLVASTKAVITKATALTGTFVTALGTAKTAIIAKAAALKTVLLGALATAKGAVIAKAIALKTTFVGALVTAKGAVIAKAIALKTTFIGALLAAKAAIISKATTIYTSFMGAMTTAISAVSSFAVSIYTSFIAPVFAAIASVFTFAASLIASAIPALVAVTGAVISFTVALLANPIVLIGMAIAAVAYLIYDNFDTLFNFMISGFTMVGDIFSTIGNGLASIFIGIVDGLKGIVNAMIGGVNFMINGLNTISFTIPDWVPFVGGETFGINIPLIPLLQEGGEIAGDGAAYLHQGEKVVPAAQVEQLDDSIQTASSMLVAAPMMAMAMMNPVTMIAGAVGGIAAGALGRGEGTANDNEDVVAAIKENTAAVNTLVAAMGNGAGTTQPGGGTTVVLEVNERQLGKAVTKVLNDKNSLTLAT